MSKYQGKLLKERKNKYLDDLIDPSFKRADIIFILSFENKTDREVRTGYYLPKREVKDYMIDGVIDGGNFFDQQIKDDKITYDNLEKIATGEVEDFATGSFLLDYLYFKQHYKPIATDLSKKMDAEIWNKMEIQDFCFFIEEAKETVFDFLNGTVKALQFYFALI